MSGTFAAIGVKFLPLVTWVAEPWRKKTERRIAASKVFRESVLRELSGLYPLPRDWHQDFDIRRKLESVYPALANAVNAFEPYVPEKKRSEFQKAWRRYRNPYPDDRVIESYHEYMGFKSQVPNGMGGDLTLSTDSRQAFKKNVDRLLSFASEV